MKTLPDASSSLLYSWELINQLIIFLIRTGAVDHLPVERAADGDGDDNPRVVRDTNQRAGLARRVRVREGDEELVHFAAVGRAESAAPVPH